MELMEVVQQRVMKIMKGLEHRSYEERLRLSSLEKGFGQGPAWAGSHLCVQISEMSLERGWSKALISDAQ